MSRANGLIMTVRVGFFSNAAGASGSPIKLRTGGMLDILSMVEEEAACTMAYSFLINLSQLSRALFIPSIV